VVEARVIDSWIDQVRVTSRLLSLLSPGDAVNIVVGNSTLTRCPYLLPVNALTSRRLITSLLRLRPSVSRRHHAGSHLSTALVWNSHFVFNQKLCQHCKACHCLCL